MGCSMAVNKVTVGDYTLFDLTNDTVTADSVKEGITFHDNRGIPLVGTLNVNGGTGGEVSVSLYLHHFEIINPDHCVVITYDYYSSSNTPITDFADFASEVLKLPSSGDGGTYGFASAPGAYATSNNSSNRTAIYGFHGGLNDGGGSAVIVSLTIVGEENYSLFGSTGSEDGWYIEDTVSTYTLHGTGGGSGTQDCSCFVDLGNVTLTDIEEIHNLNLDVSLTQEQIELLKTANGVIFHSLITVQDVSVDYKLTLIRSVSGDITHGDVSATNIEFYAVISSGGQLVGFYDHTYTIVKFIVSPDDTGTGTVCKLYSWDIALNPTIGLIDGETGVITTEEQKQYSPYTTLYMGTDKTYYPSGQMEKPSTYNAIYRENDKTYIETITIDDNNTWTKHTAVEVGGSGSNVPTPTDSDNGKFLGVTNGNYALQDISVDGIADSGIISRDSFPIATENSPDFIETSDSILNYKKSTFVENLSYTNCTTANIADVDTYAATTGKDVFVMYNNNLYKINNETEELELYYTLLDELSSPKAVIGGNTEILYFIYDNSIVYFNTVTKSYERYNVTFPTTDLYSKHNYAYASGKIWFINGNRQIYSFDVDEKYFSLMLNPNDDIVVIGYTMATDDNYLYFYQKDINGDYEYELALYSIDKNTIEKKYLDVELKSSSFASYSGQSVALLHGKVYIFGRKYHYNGIVNDTNRAENTIKVLQNETISNASITMNRSAYNLLAYGTEDCVYLIKGEYNVSNSSASTKTNLIDKFEDGYYQYSYESLATVEDIPDVSNFATTTQVEEKYTKPSTGIPKTDLASDVQTSIGKADTALQSVPLATSSAIGGVKPVAKTDDMTQSVGVDASGALFTAPSGGGGSEPKKYLHSITVRNTSFAPSLIFFSMVTDDAEAYTDDSEIASVLYKLGFRHQSTAALQATGVYDSLTDLVVAVSNHQSDGTIITFSLVDTSNSSALVQKGGPVSVVSDIVTEL